MTDNSRGVALFRDILLDLQHVYYVGREYTNLLYGWLYDWITGNVLQHIDKVQICYLPEKLKLSSFLLVTAVLFLTVGIFYNLFSRRKSKVVVYTHQENTVAFTAEDDTVRTPKYTHYPYSWNVFDLAKTAYEPGHTATVIDIIERLHYNVNASIPLNGLTLFLCACLSGQGQLIRYMLKRGADVKCSTKARDTALYLATFGILGSSKPDVDIISDLIRAGCDVNAANLAGYTALHRAAGHGNIEVIQALLKYGADRYQASASGIYPIDSAINAGNLEAAKLLEISVPNPHVWDVVDPHTPPHIKMGLQSPQRKHLIESTQRIMSPRVISHRVT